MKIKKENYSCWPIIDIQIKKEPTGVIMNIVRQQSINKDWVAVNNVSVKN